MIVKESILKEGKKNKLDLSAGLVIIQDNKILLVHPTGSSWKGTYSIPKGHVEEGEDLIDAAIRETGEEIGINTNQLIIEDSEPKFIDYTNDKGQVYKRVYYFITRPQKLIEKKHFDLQKKEVDWAGFVDKKEAKRRIFSRFLPFLNLLK